MPTHLPAGSGPSGGCTAPLGRPHCALPHGPVQPGLRLGSGSSPQTAFQARQIGNSWESVPWCFSAAGWMPILAWPCAVPRCVPPQSSHLHFHAQEQTLGQPTQEGRALGRDLHTRHTLLLFLLHLCSFSGDAGSSVIQVLKANS